MSVLHQIAFHQGRRDEVPNQELARELAHTRNTEDIAEIAAHLWDPESNIRSDCLKVLYELGYLAPELIAGYVDDFLRLLQQRNNRLVWGGMIALSTIARLQADRLFPHFEAIQKAMRGGSVITNDAGMRTLAGIAHEKDEYRLCILPFLLARLAEARAVDAPRYAEEIVNLLTPADREQFLAILDVFIQSTDGGRLGRLQRVRKQALGVT